MSILATTAAACALAVLPVLALAGGAQADSIHIKYGDLSNPEQAAAFNHRVEAAADNLCASIPLGAVRGERMRECRDDVRAEAVEQLGRVQRDQLASHSNRLAPVQLAGAR